MDRQPTDERLVIQRRSFRPGNMTPEQQAALRVAAEAVIRAYVELKNSLDAAIEAQIVNCGGKSYESMMQYGRVHSDVEMFVKLLPVKIEFPKLFNRE